MRLYIQKNGYWTEKYQLYGKCRELINGNNRFMILHRDCLD